MKRNTQLLNVAKTLTAFLCSCLLGGIFVLSAHAASPLNSDASFYLDPKNRTMFILIYDKKVISTVDAYGHAGGLFVSLEDIAETLRFPLIINPESHTARGNAYIPNTPIMFIPQRGEIITNGKIRSYPPNLFFPDQERIMIDLSLLSKILPIHLQIDYEKRHIKATIKPDITEANKARIALYMRQPLIVIPPTNFVKNIDDPVPFNETVLWESHGPDAPTPLATTENKSKGPLPFDENILWEVAAQKTSQPSITTTPTTLAQKPKSPPPAKPKQPIQAPAPPEDALFHEDYVLVLQLEIDKGIYQEFVEAYQKDDTLFLPLAELSTFFDFPITTNLAQQTASGWFIDEQNQFSIDLPNKTASLKGKKIPLSPNDVHINGQDMYINATLLSEWFGLDFSVNTNRMALLVGADGSLPFQQQLLRETNRKRKLKNPQGVENANYERIKAPYKAADWPFIDISLNSGYDSQRDQPISTNSSIHARGDLAFMSGDLFASGDLKAGELSDLRLSLSRRDYDKKLLGPLAASEFIIGDINSATLPLTAATSTGRGMRISNRALNRPTQFDRTDFIGNILPGWEVELYRNGALIDFQLAGNDGRYEFLNIPVLFGNNSFRVVLYGPQGQVEEEVQRLFIGSSILTPGEFNYTLSLDEKSHTLFEQRNLISARSPEAFRGVGQIEYGLTSSTSLTAGIAKTEIENGEHTYFTSGIRNVFGGWFFSLDNAYDVENSGFGTRLSTSTSFDNISMRAEQSFFNNFTSEQQNEINDPITHISDLDINATLALPFIKDIGLGLRGTYEKQESGRSVGTIRNRLSKSFFGINLSNNLEFTVGDEDRLEGTLSNRGRIGDVLWGTNVGYRFRPEKEIHNVSMNAQRPINDKMSARIQLTKDLSNNGTTQLGTSVTTDFETHRLSVIGNVNDDSDVFVGINFNISLGKKPDGGKWHKQSRSMASSASVDLRAFIDKDHNNIYGPDEDYLDNAIFKIRNRAINMTDGRAFFAQLTPDEPVDITIDNNSFDDPFLVSAIDGFNVISRPGRTVSIDFPVYEALEIEGVIYLAGGGGSPEPIEGAVIELVDEKGVVIKKVLSEFDGFYLFTGILPGKYTIKVDDNFLEQKDMRLSKLTSISPAAGEGFYADNDLYLLSRSPEKVAPTNSIARAIQYRLQLGAYRSESNAMGVWQ